MTQQLSPWLEGKYGWNFGESGWNSGMDQNLLKFSFLFDKNIDGVVSSLPPVGNGKAYFLTTDSRLYFAVGTVWYSTTVPKWFQFTLKSNGDTYQFNGVSAVLVDSLSQLDSRIVSVEVTLTSLGTAAYQNTEFFATSSQLDVAEASSAAYTDTLRSDMASITGSSNVGHTTGTVASNLNELNLDNITLLPRHFGILSVEQGAVSPVAEAVKWENMRVAAQSMKAHVVIPAGTYVLPQGVRLDADDTVWNFSPGALIKLWDTQANGDFLVFSAPARQRVTGLRFDANRAMQNSALFGGDHCACIIINPTDCLIEATHIVSSPGKGLALVSSEGGTSSNTTIRGVTGGDCNDQAVLVDGNNMLGFFKKIVLEDVQIGTTSHAGVAVNDGVHDIQLNNINCDVNNSAWDAVAVRDCWDVQLSNVRGRRGLNGVGISSFVGVCRRIQLNNVVGESNNVSGVLLFAAEDVNGGNVTGYNNGYSGINVAQTGGGARCKNISIANPSCFDDRGGGALQDYGLVVSGCDGGAFGKGSYHGNTVRGVLINRAVSTQIDVDVVQRKSATTGSIAATSSANVTVTFDVPFEDEEYDVSGEVFVATASLALEIGHVVAKTAGGVTFLVRNTTTGALTGTLSVVASRRP